MGTVIRHQKNRIGLLHRATMWKQNRPQAASYQEVVKTESLVDVLKRCHGFYGYTLEEAIAVAKEAGYEVE